MSNSTVNAALYNQRLDNNQFEAPYQPSLLPSNGPANFSGSQNQSPAKNMRKTERAREGTALRAAGANLMSTDSNGST